MENKTIVIENKTKGLIMGCFFSILSSISIKKEDKKFFLSLCKKDIKEVKSELYENKLYRGEINIQ